MTKLGWWISNFDAENKIWFEEAYPKEPATVVGQLNAPGGKDFRITVSQDPTRISQTLDTNVYNLYFEVIPAANSTYNFHFATSAKTPYIRNWGLKVGSDPRPPSWRLTSDGHIEHCRERDQGKGSGSAIGRSHVTPPVLHAARPTTFSFLERRAVGAFLLRQPTRRENSREGGQIQADRSVHACGIAGRARRITSHSLTILSRSA